MTDKPKSKRRWLQFSLRTLFVVVTVFCVWMGITAKRARDQRQTVEAIREMGGLVFYEHQLPDGVYTLNGPTSIIPPFVRLDSTFLTLSDPPGPKWLRRIVGDEYFFTVAQVYLYGPHFTDAGLVAIGRLTDVQLVSLNSTQITDAGLVHLERLTDLEELLLDGAAVTDERVEKLRQALPNCKITR